MNIEIAPKETEIRANWENAVLYCQFLTADGKTDWRLPTLVELNYINKSENDFTDDYYWTSTEFDDDGAWGQYFYNGVQGYLPKFNRNYARAVRDIK